MRSALLGGTIKVSRLCLGTNVFGWNTDEGQAHAVLTAFAESGGNFIDTADSYSVWVEGNPGGVSESIIGRWLRTVPRDDFVIATKVGQMPDFPGYTRSYVNQQLDASLGNLQTERIDLYYAHKDDERQPLADVVRLFHELVESGRVHHIGLSNFSAERTSEWIRIAKAEGLHCPVAIQPHYNLMVRREYETGLGPVAMDLGLDVIPYAGLARGFLSGRYDGTETADSGARAQQALGYATVEGLAVLAVVKEIASVRQVSPATIALAWLLARPEILAPIASSSSLEQLPDLVAATTLELGSDELIWLNNLDNGED